MTTLRFKLELHVPHGIGNVQNVISSMEAGKVNVLNVMNHTVQNIMI